MNAKTITTLILAAGGVAGAVYFVNKTANTPFLTGNWEKISTGAIALGLLVSTYPILMTLKNKVA